MPKLTKKPSIFETVDFGKLKFSIDKFKPLFSLTIYNSINLKSTFKNSLKNLRIEIIIFHKFPNFEDLIGLRVLQ